MGGSCRWKQSQQGDYDNKVTTPGATTHMYGCPAANPTCYEVLKVCNRSQELPNTELKTAGCTSQVIPGYLVSLAFNAEQLCHLVDCCDCCLHPYIASSLLNHHRGCSGLRLSQCQSPPPSCLLGPWPDQRPMPFAWGAICPCDARDFCSSSRLADWCIEHVSVSCLTPSSPRSILSITPVTQIAQSLQALEANAQQYNGAAHHLKLVPATAKHAEGATFELRLNRDPTSSPHDLANLDLKARVYTTVWRNNARCGIDQGNPGCGCGCVDVSVTAWIVCPCLLPSARLLVSEWGRMNGHGTTGHIPANRIPGVTKLM